MTSFWDTSRNSNAVRPCSPTMYSSAVFQRNSNICEQIIGRNCALQGQSHTPGCRIYVKIVTYTLALILTRISVVRRRLSRSSINFIIWAFQFSINRLYVIGFTCKLYTVASKLMYFKFFFTRKSLIYGLRGTKNRSHSKYNRFQSAPEYRPFISFIQIVSFIIVLYMRKNFNFCLYFYNF